jgi:hypothetical protein
MNYKSLKKDEIRKIIVKNGLGPVSNRTTKEDMIKMLSLQENYSVQKEEIFNLEEDNDVETPSVKPQDPEWTDYVISQFTPDELKSGYPTVDGLRRVTEKVFGIITEYRINVLEIPDASYKKCTVQCQITVERYDNGRTVIAEASVDVRADKTEFPFQDYLVATADSRAEGKALRRILKVKLISAEEVSLKEEDDADLTAMIDSQQIQALNALCEHRNIDVMKLLSKHGKFDRVESVPKLTARQLFKDITEQQNNPKETLVGYDPDWRDK